MKLVGARPAREQTARAQGALLQLVQPEGDLHQRRNNQSPCGLAWKGKRSTAVFRLMAAMAHVDKGFAIVDFSIAARIAPAAPSHATQEDAILQFTKPF